MDDTLGLHFNNVFDFMVRHLSTVRWVARYGDVLIQVFFLSFAEVCFGS